MKSSPCIPSDMTYEPTETTLRSGWGDRWHGDIAEDQVAAFTPLYTKGLPC